MLETIFQNTTQQLLSKYTSQVRQINKFGNEYLKFTDIELKEKTKELRQRLLNGEPESIIINESFALTREASHRVLGLRHYDVQLIGGLVLNEAKIAEMKTGEGKTIVALLPTFLNALIPSFCACPFAFSCALNPSSSYSGFPIISSLAGLPTIPYPLLSGSISILGKGVHLWTFQH